MIMRHWITSFLLLTTNRVVAARPRIAKLQIRRPPLLRRAGGRRPAAGAACYRGPRASNAVTPSPASPSARTDRAAHRGGRAVHGERRFDRDRDLAAGDRGRYRHGPARAQARHHLLSHLACSIPAALRLDRGPLRRAARVPRRDRGVHGWLD